VRPDNQSVPHVPDEMQASAVQEHHGEERKTKSPGSKSACAIDNGGPYNGRNERKAYRNPLHFQRARDRVGGEDRALTAAQRPVYEADTGFGSTQRGIGNMAGYSFSIETVPESRTRAASALDFVRWGRRGRIVVRSAFSPVVRRSAKSPARMARVARWNRRHEVAQPSAASRFCT